MPLDTLRRKVLEVKRPTDRFLSLGPIREAAALFGASPEDLLWNHTQFPYATAFSGEVDLARAIDGASGNGKERRTPVINLTRVGLRRICKQCLEDDLRTLGETHWHRAHNLPGTFYCVKHRCLLHRTSVEAHMKVTTLLPADCELLEPLPAWESPGAFALAVASVAQLNRSRAACAEKRDAEFYLNLATERGFLSSGPRLNQTAWTEHFLNWFSPEFLKACAVEFGATPWPHSAFRAKRNKLSPLRHLMVETALRHGDSTRLVLDHRGDRAQHARRASEDSRQSVAALALLKRLKDAGLRLKLGPFLERIGASTAWHCRKHELPKLAAVIGDLRAWNCECPKIQKSEWKSIDSTLAAAAACELGRLKLSREALEIREFMARIGAMETWRHHQDDVPKLCRVAKGLLTWNRQMRARNFDSKLKVQDQRFASAAARELVRARQTGTRVTLRTVLKRIGAETAWRYHKRACPKLQSVAREICAWERYSRSASVRPARAAASSSGDKTPD